MAKPSDIPQDVWDEAKALIAAVENCVPEYNEWHFDASIEVAARALLAAQERAILAERARAVAACEAQKADFLSPEYAFNQPLGSLLERFACDECIAAIRSPVEPIQSDDPTEPAGDSPNTVASRPNSHAETVG